MLSTLLLAFIFSLTVPGFGDGAFPFRPGSWGSESHGGSRNQADLAAELHQVVELLQAGSFREAEASLRRLLLAHPNNSDLHNLLGLALNGRSDPGGAEREYRTAMRLNRQGVSARANLGVLLARSNRAAEAIKILTEVLRVAPDHPEANLNLGLQLSLRGEYGRALPLLRRAVALGLDTYDARLWEGISLYNLKRFDESTQEFEAALSHSAKPAEAYYFLGLIAWDRGHDEQAADSWDQAVALRPNFPDAHFMLGEALRKNQRTQAAVEFYKRALEQDETKFAYYARLGGTYIVLGQLDNALDIFRRAGKHFPASPQAHYFIGLAARAQGDYDVAETEFRKSLALENDNVNALAQLGFVLLERDKPVAAERTLRRALAIDARHFYANYDLGRLLVKSRRFEEALPVLQHAIALKPKNPGAHYQLFLTLTRLKHKQDADAELQKFKLLDAERKAHPSGDEDDIENSNPEPPPGTALGTARILRAISL